jgi:sarcosine oxidase subunit beta
MNRHLPKQADVIIIGGGIIGVSTAYYLARKGVKDVLLLERDIMGEGATGKCAGGIRTQFSTEINVQFSLVSRGVFEKFQEEFGVDPEFHQTGYLFLTADESRWKNLQQNTQLLKTLNVEVELLNPKDIQSRWPFLKVDDLVGGSYTAHDGYAGIYEVLNGFINGARRHGAKLCEQVEVTGIKVENSRLQAVETATGEQVETRIVVNTTGPYAAGIAALAGLDLPVRPLRRQIFFTDTFDDLPATFPMVIDLERGWYMRREGKGLLLAGPQDAESSFNETVDFEGKEWTATNSVHRVPVLQRAQIASGWAGLYDISPDHHAIIGTFPELPGFICANGFSGHGFQHSPAAGMLVAELIVEGKARTIDITPLRPQRFREGALIREPLVAFLDGDTLT